MSIESHVTLASPEVEVPAHLRNVLGPLSATVSPEQPIDATRTAEIAVAKKILQTPTAPLPKRKVAVPEKDYIRYNSAALTAMPLNKIRNKTLRRILAVARMNGVRQSDVQQDVTNVVYAIYHTKTSRFYIGETSKTVTVRLYQHWSTNKVSSGTTELSRFFVNRRLKFPQEDVLRSTRAKSD